MEQALEAGDIDISPSFVVKLLCDKNTFPFWDPVLSSMKWGKL